MSDAFEVTGTVRRFEREGGWFYLEIPDDPGFDLRGRVNAAWPKLLAATCTTGDTTWQGSIMPIKDGPLFVAITKPVRQAEDISASDEITIFLRLVHDE